LHNMPNLKQRQPRNPRPQKKNGGHTNRTVDIYLSSNAGGGDNRKEGGEENVRKRGRVEHLKAFDFRTAIQREVEGAPGARRKKGPTGAPEYKPWKGGPKIHLDDPIVVKFSSQKWVGGNGEVRKNCIRRTRGAP